MPQRLGTNGYHRAVTHHARASTLHQSADHNPCSQMEPRSGTHVVSGNQRRLGKGAQGTYLLVGPSCPSCPWYTPFRGGTNLCAQLQLHGAAGRTGSGQTKEGAPPPKHSQPTYWDGVQMQEAAATQRQRGLHHRGYSRLSHCATPNECPKQTSVKGQACRPPPPGHCARPRQSCCHLPRRTCRGHATWQRRCWPAGRRPWPLPRRTCRGRAWTARRRSGRWPHPACVDEHAMQHQRTSGAGHGQGDPPPGPQMAAEAQHTLSRGMPATQLASL